MKKFVLMMVVAFLLFAFSSMSYASDTATVNINATVVGVCKFVPPKTTTISVSLDPSVGGTVTGSSTLSFWCTKGTTYTITDDNGLYHGGTTTHRVKHGSLDEYIPYIFNYTSSGTGQGANNDITLNVSASFAEADYEDASAGTYSDTVTMTINP